MAKLLDSVQLGAHLGVELLVRLLEIFAHRVHGTAELTDLVTLVHRQATRELSATDEARVVNQLSDWAADHDRPEPEDEHRAQKHERAGRDGGLDDGVANVGVLRRERLTELD